VEKESTYIGLLQRDFPREFGVVRGSEERYMEDGFGVAVVNLVIAADGIACYSERIS
jgi:hypothetical protein